VENEKSPCGQLLVNFAMENSKPVIATDCYGVKDYVVNGKNGILFKLGQADEIRKGYEKLINDEGYTQKIIENAKNTSKIMSRGSFIEKIISIIEDKQPESKIIEVNI
jgi:glycosyltransferase involved in cell wall biosynthesis